LRLQADNKALLQLRKLIQDTAENTSEQTASVPQVSCPASEIAGNGADVKEIAEKAEYEWKGRIPFKEERMGMQETLVAIFREKYIDLKAQARRIEADRKKTSVLQTDMYEKEQKLGLQLKGGHQPMARPEGVEIPSSFRSPVGTLSVKQLGEHGPQNREKRLLLSVYGSIFDVSDRPDKYGPDGPYNELTGKDITWGLFTGVDTPEMCNRFYDLFKAKDQGKDKLAGICSWLAWYETEYGKPVGRLEPYEDEHSLPEPPLHEIDAECAVM